MRCGVDAGRDTQWSLRSTTCCSSAPAIRREASWLRYCSIIGGKGQFKGYSAGSFPKGAVHPLALDLLERVRLPTRDLRSKSWSEFAQPNAPEMDFVFTVCDQAAGEVCPVWPGNPITAHWGVPDPAAVEGTEAERRRAFRDVFRQLEARIKLFIALPIDKLDRMALKRRADEIGRST